MIVAFRSNTSTGLSRDVVGEVVGRPVNSAVLNAASGHPDGKAARMMIAAVVCRCEFPLRINRSTKFTSPDNERVVKQSSLLQVFHQGSRGLVGVAALLADLAGQV